jgi:hypothetical protein
MEVYALLALQFCDGEDLMSLYWSTWTMLQLGSLVAIAGIILSVYNGIRGNKNPYAPSIPTLLLLLTSHQPLGARTRHTRSRRRWDRTCSS